MPDLIFVAMIAPFFAPCGSNVGGMAMMSLDYVLGAVVAGALTVYLVYALLRPERF